ncbi:hydrolase 1, exosortase A system-associated [Hydrogenophaga sp.]|uniref:hydrolase 1, exosortase A system-associated n=1 Tax=Hydrogenophaga sp. TaxID=1904254 RepID=UPI002AB9D153|nr:hydrolase 1, exosortase A system-associated [Hydrogenophaga sp.]MDZ4397918.1 hydrolase 1, exosortase A system-associated [Hydrogenophaga sp.]
MTINEQPLWLHGEGFDMLGIVSLPPASTPAQRTGVVIVVGGAQYRAGSHRQFTQLARFLAEGGFPVLRFDLPGMGDSPGELPSFEDTAPHIAAAIDGFQKQHPSVERVVLWGLCDGASASLLYVDATHDPRIAGLALLNPWVRSEASLARARVKHYYRRRLLEGDFWRKLLTGKLGLVALMDLQGALKRMASTRPAVPSFQTRMAAGWNGFQGPILLALSELDLTANEFNEAVKNAPFRKMPPVNDCIQTVQLRLADHTISNNQTRIELERITLEWLAEKMESR